jgi:hypothetical protein
MSKRWIREQERARSNKLILSRPGCYKAISNGFSSYYAEVDDAFPKARIWCR